jgi:hypothetical protein
MVMIHSLSYRTNDHARFTYDSKARRSLAWYHGALTRLKQVRQLASTPGHWELTGSRIRFSSTSAVPAQDPSPSSHTQLEATSSQLFITWPNGSRTALYVLPQHIVTRLTVKRPPFLVRSLQMPKMFSFPNETTPKDIDGRSP